MMMRATELRGRPVVDMDAAEKLGRVEAVVVDPDARRIAGFHLSRRDAAPGSGAPSAVPASAVYAIGPDAITVHHDARVAVETDEAYARLEELPRLSDVIGRPVVSEHGRFLGVIEDVLVAAPDARIVGYELAPRGLRATLERMFATPSRPAPYLRADAMLRAGRDLVVAPEDAVVRTGEQDSAPSASTPAGADPFRRSPGSPPDRRRGLGPEVGDPGARPY